MSKKSKKYTPDVLAIGVLSFAGSAVTQRILIQPKTEIKINDSIKIPVQGILPFSQEYLAEITRKALNDALPVAMSTTITLCEKLHVREEFKNGVLWFIYDFLNKYSLNTIVSKALGRFEFFDKEKYKDVLREFIQKLIEEKADRDAIIQTVTAEVVNILRLITEGTLASMIFNDRFAEAASGTIAAAIDRYLDNEAAGRVTDYLFDIVGKLEDVTLANFLTNMLGLGRVEMANFIDNTYDAILGPSMINTVKDMKMGDIVYDTIKSVDYDEVYRFVSTSMSMDLLRINVGSAMTAMSFYAAAKKRARKHYKRRDRYAKFTKGVKSIFKDEEFLKDEE